MATYVRHAPKHYKLSFHGIEYDIRIIGTGKREGDLKPLYIEVDGRLEEVMIEVKEYEEVIETAVSNASGKGFVSSGDYAEGRPKATRDGDVSSPLPGRIVNILIATGDTVKFGQPIAVVEAMKMENEIHAPKDGVVRELYVNVGDNVMPDEALVFID